MAFQQFLEVCSQRQLAHDSPLNFHLIVGFLYILITTGKYQDTSHAVLTGEARTRRGGEPRGDCCSQQTLAVPNPIAWCFRYTHVYSVHTPVTPTHTPARHNEACRPLLSYWPDRK